MITIIEALGKDYKKIELYDNECLTGGKSHCDETLGEFMAECGIDENMDYGELCVKLEKCGIQAVRPIAFVDQSERIEQGLKVYNLLEEY